MGGDFSLSQLRAVINVLLEAKRPVLVAHPHPDGDTLGAALAMWNALREVKMGSGGAWRPVVFCADKPSMHYSYMHGAMQVVNDLSVFRDADVVCTFDAGDLIFAGIAKVIMELREIRRNVRVINIDHHATNQKFGDVNIVDVSACSTTEMVYRMLHAWMSEMKRGNFSREVATCLLTGILTDTSGFSNPGTTQSSFVLAAELVRAGAKMQDVQRNLVRNMPIAGLRLWGSALERLKYDAAQGVASTVVATEDFVRERLQDENAEGISNFLGRCLVAETIMVLKERDGEVRGSLRTVFERRDVSEVAKKLGGGGHRKAAGFVLRGKVREMPTGWGVER